MPKKPPVSTQDLAKISEHLPTTKDVPSAEQSSQMQLALELFKDLGAIDEPISSAETPIGYNRADILLDIDRMTLLGRRALDIAYFIVANSHSHDKYIAVSRDDGLKSYSVDKGFFLWLMSYSSRNWAHLQEAMNQSHEAKVTVSIGEKNDTGQAFIAKKGKSISNPENWVTVSLVIASGVNRDRVFFQIHPKLEAFIRSPDRYHFLDLRFVFSTLYGRLLHEKISPHICAGETPWYTHEEVRLAMKSDAASLHDPGYLWKKVLLPAIDDINRSTDLMIERVVRRDPLDKRKIDAIKFKIERKTHQQSANTMDEMATSYDILLNEFGLNQTQLRTITKNRDEWNNSRIEQAVEYTRWRLRRGEIKSSPAGYLMKALKEGYVVGTARLELEAQRASGDPQQTQPLSPAASGAEPESSDYAQQKTETDELFTQRSVAGLRTLTSLSEDQVKDLMDAYLQSPTAKISASGDQVDLKSIDSVEKLISTPLLSKNFGAFLFYELKTKKKS